MLEIKNLSKITGGKNFMNLMKNLSFHRPEKFRRKKHTISLDLLITNLTDTKVETEVNTFKRQKLTSWKP